MVVYSTNKRTNEENDYYGYCYWLLDGYGYGYDSYYHQHISCPTHKRTTRWEELRLPVRTVWHLWCRTWRPRRGQLSLLRWWHYWNFVWCLPQLLHRGTLLCYWRLRLMGGVPPPNDGSYWMYCITSSVHSYLRWGVPPPNDGSYWMYCITSSVHSYLRCILTAGDGGEVVSAGHGGGCRLFFYFTNHMFERFTSKWYIHYCISFFTSPHHFARFTMYDFYLTIYRVILSLGGGKSVT